MMSLQSCLRLAGALTLAGVMLVATGKAQEGGPAKTPESKPSPKPVQVGDSAPDFTLPSLGDKPVKLSSRFGADGRPVILLFSRANW